MAYDPPKSKATDKDIDAVLALPLKKKSSDGKAGGDDVDLSLEEAQAAEKEAYTSFADTIKAGDAEAGVEAFHKLLDACQKVDDLGGYEEEEPGDKALAGKG